MWTIKKTILILLLGLVLIFICSPQIMPNKKILGSWRCSFYIINGNYISSYKIKQIYLIFKSDGTFYRMYDEDNNGSFSKDEQVNVGKFTIFLKLTLQDTNEKWNGEWNYTIQDTFPKQLIIKRIDTDGNTVEFCFNQL